MVYLLFLLVSINAVVLGSRNLGKSLSIIFKAWEKALNIRIPPKAWESAPVVGGFFKDNNFTIPIGTALTVPLKPTLAILNGIGAFWDILKWIDIAVAVILALYLTIKAIAKIRRKKQIKHQQEQLDNIQAQMQAVQQMSAFSNIGNTTNRPQ